MAVPPREGVGAVCTLRSSGATTRSEEIAKRRTTGVANPVATAATAPTNRWGTMPGMGQWLNRSVGPEPQP